MTVSIVFFCRIYEVKFWQRRGC